jgi:flagellar motor protein MotB
MKAARHEADFAHSLTDLMSGVAVMFLVIAAIFMVQASHATRQAKDLAKENKERADQSDRDAQKFKDIDKRDQQGIREIEQLYNRLHSDKDVEVVYDSKKDPRLLTIVFSRDNLNFASGQCEITGPSRDAMHATLRRIFPEICAAVGSGSIQKSITLEGHTDNEPPLGVRCAGVASANACYRGHKEACTAQGFESNVQLSAARAQYVFFEARKALQDDPRASCLEHSFLVAGRGPMDPLDGDRWDKRRTPAENDRNRRVVIRVRVMASVKEGTP